MKNIFHIILYNLFYLSFLIQICSGAFSPCSGKAKLSEECDRDSDCENKGSICLRGVCHCHPFYVKMASEKGGLPRCIRLPAKIGADCSTKCREPLFCRNGKCQCVQRGSTSILNGECVSISKVGDRCSRHYDCTSPFSACVAHTCVCISGTVQQGSKCVATSNCPFGGQPTSTCIRRALMSHIPNFVERADNCPDGSMCITTPDSPIGHCCPKVCPLGTVIDNNYTCMPGSTQSSGSSIGNLTRLGLLRRCPSDTHFCHYLSGDSFAQAACCKRPCNAMAPEALYLNGECVARGQLGSECHKHEQCGAAEGMECHKNVCRCAAGFKPETDETTNPMTNPSQKCVRSCEAGSFTRDTTCLVKSILGGPCFVQAQCPENAGCYRGRCLCKCDHKKASNNKCIKVEVPTTPPPPQGPIPGVPGIGNSHPPDFFNIIGNIGNLFGANNRAPPLPIIIQQ
uniref:EB domain-containing protein n=1 Tax=Panagrolaimus sp. PS1159 TaxID=55785 RepID=A0AC35G5I0_9BILA